ncbi:MAG: glycoside hydrolase family 99-like domain-containing protein [Candidatus Muirbacterium halophilum]|nr:glycoside hydrolase family 99-like domain-containing protein [Candidatus Muirbacterium halophilum]MCK9477303.1 glycoside hydrolase family 99-like domain-containing protein [Candidatus Muirbacterium halophilum]
MKNNNFKARIIAFYLPQFHPIEENNKWWGKGFTEWTNVGKAKPLFEGHKQPKLPADLGYYDLRVKETRREQAKLAKEHGVEAFCYWHYWFAGKQLLELPFQEVVKDKEIDFPFCLGWANQTWSGIWHGAPDKILIEQTYPGIEDYKKHFYSLLEAFKDERYMKIDGKLVFLIYNPKNLPDAKEFTKYWRELAQKEGLNGFHFIAHLSNEARKYGCDSCVENAPFLTMKATMKGVKYLDSIEQPTVYEYKDLVNYSTKYQLNLDENELPLVMPNWDNTPRSKGRGVVLEGSTPELFKEILHNTIQKVKKSYKEEYQIIFVKAWNEWAEGNYLEPDSEFGLQYLEALREELICISYVNKE